jgi:hypothetical protein
MDCRWSADIGTLFLAYWGLFKSVQLRICGKLRCHLVSYAQDVEKGYGSWHGAIHSPMLQSVNR